MQDKNSRTIKGDDPAGKTIMGIYAKYTFTSCSLKYSMY